MMMNSSRFVLGAEKGRLQLHSIEYVTLRRCVTVG